MTPAITHPVQAVEFHAPHSSGLRLKGYLHLPPHISQPVPTVIGCHGLMADSQSPKQIALASQCIRAGLAFFRFDHRGCGESQGEFREVTSLAGRCEDLIRAVTLVRSLPETSDAIGLFGSSMGGATCLATARQIDAGPLVVLAAPIRSRELSAPDTAALASDFRDHPYDPQKLRFDIGDGLHHLSQVLIFHGESDEVVPLHHARTIHARVKAPKKLITFPGGDHRMSHPAHQERFLDEATRWLVKGLLGSRKK